MEYIYYSNIEQANPFSKAHAQVIDGFIADFKMRSEVDDSKCVSGASIHDIELTELPHADLSGMHFHYSAKNHGASIEKYGLKSTIGENSAELDTKQAIYFSVGLEAVLHNWDVWLKWRLNRFGNPRAAGIQYAPFMNRDYGKEIWAYAIKWMQHMSSCEYRNNAELLNRAFEFEKTELERSDYFILDIKRGIDYPEIQHDPKKALIEGSGYAEEIYGVGLSTDLSNDLAEEWNRSTELGKEVCIPAGRIKRATAFDKNDALSVLKFLWSSYLVKCHKEEKEPAPFALLEQFINYCNS